ncbi:MAG: hypothetical protein WD872_12030 [Pirellulaceae bacterium]
MDCFLTATGSYLPGDPVANDRITTFLGSLDGELEVAHSVLRMNGIVQRHYAQDEQQRATQDVYDLASRAAHACLAEHALSSPRSADSTVLRAFAGIYAGALRIVPAPAEAARWGLSSRAVATATASRPVKTLYGIESLDRAVNRLLGQAGASAILVSAMDAGGQSGPVL